jgi:hypothetical protein
MKASNRATNKQPRHIRVTIGSTTGPFAFSLAFALAPNGMLKNRSEGVRELKTLRQIALKYLQQDSTTHAQAHAHTHAHGLACATEQPESVGGCSKESEDVNFTAFDESYADLNRYGDDSWFFWN